MRISDWSSDVCSSDLERRLLFLASDRLCLALAGARVGMRALPTNGKALAMAQPAIASEVHQALDVHRSLAAQVTFYGMVGVNGFADLQHFGVRKILNAAAMINAQLVCDLKGLGASNAMDVDRKNTRRKPMH